MKRVTKRPVLAVASFSIVAFILTAAAIVWDGLTDELGVADVAIVLGNAVKADGQPSARLRARLEKAVELYESGFVRQIIVSGGVGREGHDEAVVMKHYLVERGIPESCVHVDSLGANTYLTARNASHIMQANGMTSAIIVSQYFHVPRARMALKRFGVSVVYSAHADIFELRDFYSTAREVVAFYVYLVRTYN